MHDRWWRRINLLAALAWLLTVPVAYVLNWLASVPFVSGASIYANFVSHVAAWRADTPNAEDIERLHRIEEKLDELLSRR